MDAGLDSFAALNVMSHMDQLASLGHTIILSLHQPRPAIWSMLTQVMFITSNRKFGELMICVEHAGSDVIQPLDKSPALPSERTIISHCHKVTCHVHVDIVSKYLTQYQAAWVLLRPVELGVSIQCCLQRDIVL